VSLNWHVLFCSESLYKEAQYFWLSQATQLSEKVVISMC
jgi:hypothetical protein